MDSFSSVMALPARNVPHSGWLLCFRMWISSTLLISSTENSSPESQGNYFPHSIYWNSFTTAGQKQNTYLDAPYFKFILILRNHVLHQMVSPSWVCFNTLSCSPFFFFYPHYGSIKKLLAPALSVYDVQENISTGIGSTDRPSSPKESAYRVWVEPPGGTSRNCFPKK